MAVGQANAATRGIFRSSLRGRDAVGREAIGTLDHQEELVLRLRFGSARTPHPRAAVARLLGVSDETVRRVEDQALRKLRQSALGPVSGGWAGWDEV